MKLLKFLFIIFLLHGVCHAQNNVDDSKAIAMLKEFYRAHNSIESMIKSVPAKVYIQKSDSLQKKYCTSALNKEVKRYSENGIDFLTNDNGLDAESFKTMTITKDPSNKGVYNINYDGPYQDRNFKPIRKHAILHVGVVKEGDNYKIASVK